MSFKTQKHINLILEKGMQLLCSVIYLFGFDVTVTGRAKNVQ